MQKITEIPETRYRTIREKDALGNRSSKKVPYTGYRKVNVVSGGRRFAHFFVDLIIIEAIYYLISFLLSYIDLPQKSVFLHIILGMFTLFMFFAFFTPIYYIVFEHFFQRSPGKFLTKCVVIDIYGNKPDFGTIFLRNILRLVPFEAFSCAFSERGWHDKWSDTFVVRDEEYLKIKEALGINQGEAKL